MFGQISSQIKNSLLRSSMILVGMMLWISACQPVASNFRPPNQDEIKAFIKNNGGKLIVDKLRGDSSVLLYESDSAIGYYTLTVQEPEGTIIAHNTFAPKSEKPIMIFEELTGEKPFIAVVIQDAAILAETAAVEVFIDDQNRLGSTTDGQAGVVMISPFPVTKWESITLYNARGKVLFRLESHPVQLLRIANSGNEDIHDLKVLFPGKTAEAEANRIEFGDIPAGEMTEFREVPSGVYRYAAYEYTLDGRVATQAVMDWVGESPMQGEKFTYRIELDPSKVPGNQVLLIEVRVD